MGEFARRFGGIFAVAICLLSFLLENNYVNARNTIMFAVSVVI